MILMVPLCTFWRTLQVCGQQPGQLAAGQCVVCAKSSVCTLLQQPPAIYRLNIQSTQVKAA
jgi:hypothetical protein